MEIEMNKEETRVFVEGEVERAVGDIVFKGAFLLGFFSCSAISIPLFWIMSLYFANK